MQQGHKAGQRVEGYYKLFDWFVFYDKTIAHHLIGADSPGTIDYWPINI